MIPVVPFKHYTKKDLLHDFERLHDKLVAKEDFQTIHFDRPLTGYAASNAFFQKERLRVRSQGKISAIDYWKQNQEYIQAYKEKTGKTNDFSILTFLSFTPSQFSPYVAGRVYQHFDATHVFDPYAGWGDRCVAAMALGIDYTGCDTNKRLLPCYDKMITFYRDHSDSRLVIHFQPSESVKIPKRTDLIFSSPPFYGTTSKLVEEYPGTENSYETFMMTSLVPVVRKGLAMGIWVCLYIPENMYKDLRKHVGKARVKLTFDVKKNNLNAMEAQSNVIYCFRGETAPTAQQAE